MTQMITQRVRLGDGARPARLEGRRVKILERGLSHLPKDSRWLVQNDATLRIQ